ncbi:MAG: 3,4-dihydroxy-2-butanone-4-phosphate synthase [Planctomycetota bacterium]|nr:3,4-dihydroxy-2-butanone-4-phosphate synthase [Planctomycetota bacterium]
MLTPIPEILDELRAGRMVILVDDEGRENEGDLVLAAEHATPASINFMLSAARGYMCLSLTGVDCDRLELAPQAAVNTSVRGTPFTVSFDGHPKHGLTTGVSAAERAKTIRMAIDPGTGPDDFVRPGHINPLRSRDGGVLVRTGQTEGSVDLCRLAGLHPSAVIIEIMREDGEMARMPDLEGLAQKHGLKICSVAQVIEHRLSREALIRRLSPERGARVETEFGPFDLIAYESVVDPLPHIVLSVGGVGLEVDGNGHAARSDEPTLVRMHRRNLLGDVFSDLASSPEGATSRALHESMRRIQKEGRGAIVYLRPEGVGDDLNQRLLSIRRPERADVDRPDLTAPMGVGGNAMPMPLREFGIGGQILRDLRLKRLRLLSNHPRSLPGLEAFGLEIVDHVPIETNGG